ncbi:MAG: hypothetical protein IJ094_11895 [Bacilli bacterium]|nr:hypothetical protein [Bacilli bacterium]
MPKKVSKEEKKTRTTRFRMSDTELQKLNEVCEELQIDKSSMIRTAIVEYLARKNITICL